MADKLANIGVVGMAVMGKNLALNIESRGFTVGIYNRTASKTDQVMKDHSDKNLVPSHTIEEFVDSLEKPRRILLMVKAGKPTDAVIDELIPLLDKGDVLIDGGNTNFHDTMARNAKLDKSRINFIGMSVSGSDLVSQGPSLMPGSQKKPTIWLPQFWKDFSKATQDGKPCVTYIGPNGAGHYVRWYTTVSNTAMRNSSKLQHYARNVLGISVDDMANIFKEWNKSEATLWLKLQLIFWVVRMILW